MDGSVTQIWRILSLLGMIDGAESGGLSWRYRGDQCPPCRRAGCGRRRSALVAMRLDIPMLSSADRLALALFGDERPGAASG